jgi:hypothetical protein
MFLLKNLYWNVIGDYTVGYLFKNIRWIYFTPLQLIISWINVHRFTNHSNDYLDTNHLFYGIMFFQSPGAGEHLHTPATQLAGTCKHSTSHSTC